jgi:hypothetical protein
MKGTLVVVSMFALAVLVFSVVTFESKTASAKVSTEIPLIDGDFSGNLGMDSSCNVKTNEGCGCTGKSCSKSASGGTVSCNDNSETTTCKDYVDGGCACETEAN